MNLKVGNPKESIDTLFKLVNLARLLDSSLFIFLSDFLNLFIYLFIFN